MDGIKVHCGITIPWYADGAVWGVKVRRLAQEQRYQQVSGGNVKGCLYFADHIRPGLPIFITEDEFEASIAWQVGGKYLSPASIGAGLANCLWLLVSGPDSNQAGVTSAAEVALRSSSVQAVQVPMGKDITNFYLSAGKQPVFEWLRDVMELRT